MDWLNEWLGDAITWCVVAFSEVWNFGQGVMQNVAAWVVTKLGDAVGLMLSGIASFYIWSLGGVIGFLGTAVGALWPTGGAMLNGLRSWTTGVAAYQGNEVLGSVGYLGSIFFDMSAVVGAAGILSGAFLAAFGVRIVIWVFHQFWGSN